METGRGYDDEHRIFLQGMMSRGILDFKTVLSLLEATLGLCKIAMPGSRAERDQAIMKLVHDINDKIRDLNLTIRKGVDEEDGTNYFMLINTSQRGPVLNQVQTALSAPELEYLRLLATEILFVEDRSLPSNIALNLIGKMEGNTNKKFSLQNAENTISKLIANKWLRKLDRSHVGLGVRFIGEMGDWITECLGGEVDKCQVCRKMALRGIFCQCRVVYHKVCAMRLPAAKDDTFNCMKCKAELTRSVEDYEEGPQMVPQAPARDQAKSRKRRAIIESDED